MNLSLAKLAPPRGTHAVARERLFAKLDAFPAMWIQGPAGAGKSTLAASWLAQRKHNSAWLRLDAYDGDPATFITYLEASLRQASPRRRIDLPRPDARAETDWVFFGRGLAAAVAAGLPRRASLVLDDVQEIMGSASAALLAALIAEIPATHGLVLLSRLPPAGFEREQAAQLLGTIDWEALRFTEEEVDDLLQSLHAPDLPTERRDAAAGWAAGLVLMARAGITGASVDVRQAGGEANAMLGRYFAQQVFESLPEPKRRLLCQLAPAGEFDSGMVAAVCGESALPLLDLLVRRQVFVQRHAQRGAAGWYRIHPLFREFLCELLTRMLDADAYRAHLQQLAQGCARAGQVERAIELLLEARSARLAGDLLARHAVDLWRAGRVRQLASLARQIREAEDPETGWVDFWEGMALSSHDESSSRRAFDAARLRFHAQGDRAGEVLAAACAIEATLGLWDSFEGLEERFARIEGAHADLIAVEDPSLRLLAMAGFLDGAGHLARAQAESAQVLEQLVLDLESDADANIRLLAGTVAMSVADVMEKGELPLDIIARLEPLAEHPAVTPFRAAYWHLHAGEVLHYVSLQGQHPEAARRARRHLALAEKAAEEHHFSTLLFRVKRMKAGVAWRAGDLATAQAELDGARGLLALQKSGHRMEYHHVQAQLCILQGRLDEAFVDAQATVDLARATHAPARVCAVYWTMYGSLFLRADRYPEARDWLQRAAGASAGGHGRAYARAIALVDACEILESGADPAESLRQYFQIAREMRSFQMAQFNVPQLTRVAQAALARDIEVDYVRDLVRARHLVPQPPVPRNWPWPVRVKVLGTAQLWLEDALFSSTGKAQKKPLELLFWLAAQGTRAFEGVAATQAMDALWPDLEAEDPKGSLEAALHRLRKLLVLEDLVRLADGKLSLDPGRVWTDVADFEAAAGLPDQALTALEAYGGDLLPGAGQAWVLPLRERWRLRFIDQIGRHGQALEQAGQWETAARLYESGLSQDNLVEDFYAGCMRCCLALGRVAEGLRHYRRCRELLSIVLGIAPSAATEALHRQLLAR